MYEENSLVEENLKKEFDLVESVLHNYPCSARIHRVEANREIDYLRRLTFKMRCCGNCKHRDTTICKLNNKSILSEGSCAEWGLKDGDQCRP